MNYRKNRQKIILKNKMLKNKAVKIKLSDVAISLVLIVCLSASFAVFGLRAADRSNILYKITDYNDLLTESIFGVLTRNGFSRLNSNISDDNSAGGGCSDAIKMSHVSESYLSFSYNDTYCIYDGENMFYSATEILDIENGKYIFSDVSGRQGLKNIDGSVLIDCIYDSIAFSNDTAIALLNGVYYIYYKWTLLGHHSDMVKICENSRFIMIDNGAESLFFDLENGFSFDTPFVPPILTSNFVLLCEPDELHGVFLYYDINTDSIGYANVDKILTEPVFDSANGLTGDFSYGIIINDGAEIKYCLKYENDNMLMVNLNDCGLSNAEILPFYNGYAIFYDPVLRLYGVVDYGLNIVVAPMFQSAHEIIFNGLVFDSTLNAFFSITEKNYVNSNGIHINDSTSLHEDFFICNNSDGFSVYGGQLNLLIENCDFAFYFAATRILLVILNSQIYRFSRLA